MINPEDKLLIKQLFKKNNSIREISKITKTSRNTVRAILKGDDVKRAASLNSNENLNIIKNTILKCKNNITRANEVLSQEYNINIAYSSLTYLIRKYNLITKIKSRVGEYNFDPGTEMQHDTSPHKVIINGKEVKTQCASLVFSFSRKLFIQYYPCFTRFEAKLFLQKGFEYMKGSCKDCIIDNTSVFLAAGAGEYAVVAPEIEVFANIFNFKFTAHAVNNPNRKGKVERNFHYVEQNFLAGREFSSWEDLNIQALKWCNEIANKKIKKSLGKSPDEAYLTEYNYINNLPRVMPAIYETYHRKADVYGFVNLDTNRYSIPEKHIGKTLKVFKFYEYIKIYFDGALLATHTRVIGKKGQYIKIKSHHASISKYKATKEMHSIEKELTDDIDLTDYIVNLKSHFKGRGNFYMKKLLGFKREYPKESFVKAMEQARKYNLYDLNRLEKLILKYTAGDFFKI